MDKQIQTSTLAENLRRDHEKTGSWERTAQNFGIHKAVAYHIAERGYEPKDPHLRAKLNLPALAPAPVCIKCGEVHTAKRCTKNRKPPTRWADFPLNELRRAFANRYEIY